MHCNVVDISPDGTRLVADFYAPNGSGSSMWDISDRENIHEIEITLPPQASFFRFSKDSQRIFGTGGPSNAPAIMDTQGRVMETLEFGFSRHLDEEWTTVVTSDEIWDVATATRLAKLPKHSGIISPDWSGAAVSPVDPNLVVTGSAEGARVWDRTGNHLATLPMTVGIAITSVEFSDNGQLLAVYKGSGGIQIFNSAAADPTVWFQIRMLPVRAGSSLDFSPIDPGLIVVGDETGSLTGYRVHGNLSQDWTINHKNTVAVLRFSPDSRFLVVGMRKGEIHVWDWQTRKNLFHRPPSDDWTDLSDRFFCKDTVCFSPDSRRLAFINTQRNRLVLRDIATRTEVTLQGRIHAENPQTRYCAPEFSPDGQRLYAGYGTSESGGVEVWDIAGEVPVRIEGLTPTLSMPARSLSISGDGTKLAVAEGGDSGNCASIYALPEMKLMTELKLGVSSTQEVLLSPDGRFLASSSYNPQAVTLWDTATWKKLTSLDHPFPVTHISWSDDSKRLAASDFSAKTKVWDIETFQVVATFDGAASEFSPDGRILAVGAMGSEYVFDSSGLGHVTLHNSPRLSEIDIRP